MPFLLSIFLVAASCNSSRTLKGGAIGAGAGGAIGGLLGSKSNNTAKGAILGAAIGGAAGALVGKYMDKQAEELERDLEGAKIERVGEGIKITFASGILFATNSSSLSATSETNLTNLAETLKKYDDTEILIEGHTDNMGTDEYNQELSEKRAQSVSTKLAELAVAANRMTQVGHGESMPVADNATNEGRTQNRRVEIAIFANDKLKRAAKKGEVEEVN